MPLIRDYSTSEDDFKIDPSNFQNYQNVPVKTGEKTKLTIAIMLPQDYIRLRNFNVCIKKEMDRINKGTWSFTKYFYLIEKI